MKDAVQQQEMFVIEIVLDDGTKRYRRAGRRFEKYQRSIGPMCIFNKNTASRLLKEAKADVGSKLFSYENNRGDIDRNIIGVYLVRLGLILEDV